MNPTPTPRVDAAIERWKNRPWAGSPTDRPLMLARELERELANIKAERDQLRARVAELEADKARLLAVLDRIANCEKDTLSDAHAYTCVREMALCAIDAARGKGAT